MSQKATILVFTIYSTSKIIDFTDLQLFHLNRSWRFPRTVIEYSIHPGHFVYDARSHLTQYLPRNLCGLCRHEIRGRHRPEILKFYCLSFLSLTLILYGSHYSQIKCRWLSYAIVSIITLEY